MADLLIWLGINFNQVGITNVQYQLAEYRLLDCRTYLIQAVNQSIRQ